MAILLRPSRWPYHSWRAVVEASEVDYLGKIQIVCRWGYCWSWDVGGQSHRSLFWFQGAWELGRVFGGELFCFLFVCLFVFSTPKVGDYFVLSLTSGWGFLVFVFFFPFKMFNFPTIYLDLGLGRFFFFFVSPVGKVFCFLLFLFVCFYFYLFFFCFQKFHPPLISNVAPLSLFYYTDDGGHYVIDNFEFPCNSVKHLIPIWNFTNTFIQECKIIWEFQIRWGGTSLLRPLWRSWRYLKAYSLMSNRGRFQHFEILIFLFFFFLFFCFCFCFCFLHISVALL